MHTAYLSLGSNLGDRPASLREAIRRLEALGSVQAVSTFYETEPVEVEQAQPWFLNCAILLATLLTPQHLLAKILSLEQGMGRERREKKGPRTIDIDLLLFDGLVINTPELVIPHPAMQYRRFVLAPLAEIAPDALHPVLRRSIRELLAELPSGDGAVRRIP
jgi:2-amino-4-hydroxy-6-hydroxymethyldihydropteridine diphosphokinase